MGPAEHHVHTEYARRDGERGRGVEPEHRLEHHQPGHQLAREVEKEHQREHRNQYPNAVALIAVAQILGDRSVAETVAHRRHQPDRDQHPEIHAGGIEELAPHRRDAVLVPETGTPEKSGAARRARGEGQGQGRRAVRPARRGEIVAAAHASAPHDPDRHHGTDVEREKEPGPAEQRHCRRSLPESREGRGGQELDPELRANIGTRSRSTSP